MKSFFSVPICALALWSGPALPPRAAAQSDAAVVAAREDMEDRYQRLAARVEELVANQALQQQQINALDKSVAELRQEIARLNNPGAVQESLRALAAQIQKVDETRASENRKIYEALDELHRILKAAAAPPPSRPAPPAAPVPTPGAHPGGTEEGYEYVVQKGDTLSGIVQAYREQGIKVTSKAVMDANPNVKWDRLPVGKKIFIPKPKS